MIMVAVREIPHSSIPQTYFSLGPSPNLLCLFSLSYTNTSASLASPSHSDFHTHPHPHPHPTPTPTSTPPLCTITRYSLFSPLGGVFSSFGNSSRNTANSRFETQPRIIRWAIERKIYIQIQPCPLFRSVPGPLHIFSPDPVTAHDSPKKTLASFLGSTKYGWLFACVSEWHKLGYNNMYLHRNCNVR